MGFVLCGKSARGRFLVEVRGCPRKWLNLSDAPFSLFLSLSWEFSVFFIYIGDRFQNLAGEGGVIVKPI